MNRDLSLRNSYGFLIDPYFRDHTGVPYEYIPRDIVSLILQFKPSPILEEKYAKIQIAVAYCYYGSLLEPNLVITCQRVLPRHFNMFSVSDCISGMRMSRNCGLIPFFDNVTLKEILKYICIEADPSLLQTRVWWAVGVCSSPALRSLISNVVSCTKRINGVDCERVLQHVAYSLSRSRLEDYSLLRGRLQYEETWY